MVPWNLCIERKGSVQNPLRSMQEPISGRTQGLLKNSAWFSRVLLQTLSQKPSLKCAWWLWVAMEVSLRHACTIRTRPRILHESRCSGGCAETRIYTPYVAGTCRCPPTEAASEQDPGRGQVYTGCVRTVLIPASISPLSRSRAWRAHKNIYTLVSFIRRRHAPRTSPRGGGLVESEVLLLSTCTARSSCEICRVRVALVLSCISDTLPMTVCIVFLSSVCFEPLGPRNFCGRFKGGPEGRGSGAGSQWRSWSSLPSPSRPFQMRAPSRCRSGRRGCRGG